MEEISWILLWAMPSCPPCARCHVQAPLAVVVGISPAVWRVQKLQFHGSVEAFLLKNRCLVKL